MSRKKKTPAELLSEALTGLAAAGAAALAEVITSRINPPAARHVVQRETDPIEDPGELEQQARIVAAAELIAQCDPEHTVARLILSSPEALQKAHRRAARVLHTDMSGELSHDAIADLNAARDTVSAFQTAILHQERV